MCDYDITKQVYVVFFSIGCSLAARGVARRWRDPPFPAAAKYFFPDTVIY